MLDKMEKIKCDKSDRPKVGEKDTILFQLCLPISIVMFDKVFDRFEFFFRMC